MHGHVATDDHGHALVAIDEIAERKVRWKVRVLPSHLGRASLMPSPLDRHPCHPHHQSPVPLLLYRSLEHRKR